MLDVCWPPGTRRLKGPVGRANMALASAENGSQRTALQNACLVMAAFTLQAVILGTYYSYGQLFAALKADTSGAASVIALIGSARDFVFSLCGAPAGFMVRKVGFVRMTAAGVCMLLLSMIADSLAPSSSTLFLSCSLLGGAAMSLIFAPAAFVLYGQLSERILPIAVGFASSGVGLGTIAINAGLDHLLDTVGWRLTLRIGCVVFAPLLCSAVLSMWKGLQEKHQKSRPQEPNWSARSFLAPYRDMNFILLNVAILLYYFGFMVPYTHLVYFSREERGLDITTELTTLLGAAGTVARVCFGLGSAVARPSTILLAVVAIQGASLIWLPFCHGALELKAFAAIYGFTASGRVVLLGLLLKELFGAEQVAHLYGLLGLPFAIGNLLGPTAVGAVYDVSGSYASAFIAAGVTMLLTLPVFAMIIFRSRCRPQPDVLPALNVTEEKLDNEEMDPEKCTSC